MMFDELSWVEWIGFVIGFFNVISTPFLDGYDRKNNALLWAILLLLPIYIGHRV